MVDAVTALQQGFDVQAWHFWEAACGLFLPHEAVARVGYEVGKPMAFDDIAIEYSAPLPDGRGGTHTHRYLSVKSGRNLSKPLTARCLADPARVNCKEASLLTQLQGAMRHAESLSQRPIFEFITPIEIESSDPLRKLLRNDDDAIQTEVLLRDSADRKTADVRALWAKTMGVNESEMGRIVGSLRIRHAQHGFDRVRQQTMRSLATSGFTPTPAASRADPYCSLVQRLHREGKKWFNKNELGQFATQDGLLASSPSPPRTKGRRTLGIRQFLRWAEHLDRDTDALLCVVQYFDGRRPLDAGSWNSILSAEVRDFFAANIRRGEAYDLIVEAGTSYAFLAGYLLEPKLALQIRMRQRSMGRGDQFWTEPEPGATTPSFEWDVERMPAGGSGTDVAVAVSLTHNVLADVKRDVARRAAISEIVHFVPRSGAGQHALVNGAHAQIAAERLVQVVGSRRAGVTHVFAAAPNGFAFFLGQHARVLGDLQMYEFDFQGTSEYKPSFLVTPSLHV